VIAILEYLIARFLLLQLAVIEGEGGNSGGVENEVVGLE